jgi:hypothetical protein
MIPFGVTIPDSVPLGSEIPEGLINYPVFKEAAEGSYFPTSVATVTVSQQQGD